jgi:predicted phage terminase large subunit-like protein
LALLKRRQARKSLLGFTEYTTPRWIPGPIHKDICQALDRVVAGEVDRLLVLCPPQHGKSTIVSKRLAAYILGRDPTREIIGASATQPLADEFGGAVRDCVASPEFARLFPGVKLKEDTTAKGRWRTEQGGGYYAVGVGGALFGRGGMGIVDDPFATWEDAQSELQQRRVWEWYQGTFYNRIRPHEPIIVIQHRMSESDLVGKLLERQAEGGDRWEVVNLAADLDNPPWPARYDRAALERIRDNTDARKWSALYMQDPTPEEGDYFRRDWFRRHKADELPKGLRHYGVSDYAVTVDGGDWTKLHIWGMDFNGSVYLIDRWKGQTSTDRWIDAQCDLIVRHEPLCWFGEGGVIQKSIEPYMVRRMSERHAYCRIEWLPSVNDKPTRARSFQALASMGKVSLPTGPMGDEVLAELLKFPNGKHDDDVDCCSLVGRGLEFIRPAKAKRKDVAEPARVGSWLNV